MFKVSNFKGVMHKTVRNKTDKLLGILEKHVTSNPDQPITIGDLYFRFTLDSIGEIAFGQDLGALRYDSSSGMLVAAASLAHDCRQSHHVVVSFLFFGYYWLLPSQ